MTTREIVTVILYGVVGLISLISGIVNYVRTGKFREEVRFTTLQALRPTNGVIDWSSLYGGQSVSPTSSPASSSADFTEEEKKANLYADLPSPPFDLEQMEEFARLLEHMIDLVNKQKNKKE